MLATVSTAIQVSQSNNAPGVASAIDDFSQVMFAVALGLFGAGAIFIGQAVRAALRGERLLRSSSQPISSVRSGHVVLSGVVEPAWSLLRSPFSPENPALHMAAESRTDPEETADPASTPYVYYEARTIRGSGRSSHTVFHEENAVPFILNDGTSRVLVLGRQARWDAGTSLLDLHGADKAMAEGDNPAQIAGLLKERTLLPSPEPTHQKGDSGEPGRRSEACVAVGERVTVIGRAAADDRTQSPVDACPDDGSSFGLPGLYRIGPERPWGLNVTAGSPRDVTVRGRLRLVVGLIGVLAVAAALVPAELAVSSHVLPASGTIVFGTSFNSWSGVQGQAATLSPLRPIVGVGEFNRYVSRGDAITVLVDGSSVRTWSASGSKNGNGACEIDFAPGDLTSGRHQVVLVGPNRDLLASGTVVIGD